MTINILAYNRRDDLRTTLKEISDSIDYPKDRIEIIVNDNASADGTAEMVSKEFPEVKLIRIPRNVGIAGWNYGFSDGKGEYFLVLDDDSHPVEGVREAVAFMEENREVGVLACKIIGGAFTTLKRTDLQDWIGFIGAGAIIRKEVVERIGGYADWMFLYSHEWEYGLRVLDEGFGIKYFERCVVNHRASATHRSFKRLRTFTTRNELAIIYLYFPARRLPVLMFRTFFWNMLRFRKDGVSSIVYAVDGLLLFLGLMPRIKNNRRVVDEKVQEVYVSTFWSTQPVLLRLRRKLRSLLKKAD
ncbi:MAG: glycosyltransferase [Nitrospirae bacterium]|nr:glycosyltransferase [Nitrospirota bacterium]